MEAYASSVTYQDQDSAAPVNTLSGNLTELSDSVDRLENVISSLFDTLSGILRSAPTNPSEVSSPGKIVTGYSPISENVGNQNARIRSCIYRLQDLIESVDI